MDARSHDMRSDRSGDRWGERGTAGAAIAARLAFESVSHAYEGVASVRDVSLTVDPGEVLCLLGHSGCGKTTLLRIAAGVEHQRSGRVLINGREIAEPDVFLSPGWRGISLMFQDYALFPHLSILDNVRFGLTALPAAEVEREALHALERGGLKSYARDYPHALCGGE
ncbi:ATP-binding cassette domain-containing protein [Breoghania sp.]|uniref:ATP-binding cassette domain-containing protein n=1 Tax=Breoghania sp. TaxID=2065378 RepID=UPI003204AA4B